MTDSDTDPEQDLDALARDYLDAWQRHLSEMARDAELPAVIGRLYARSAADPSAVVDGFDGWNDAWRQMIRQMNADAGEPGDDGA